MAYFADDSPCDYFGAELAPSLRAVGWLESGHPYQRGPVAADFFDRLEGLLVNPWQPMVIAGMHHCGFCRFRPEALGPSNVFVPADGFVYVAPGGILHYLIAHEYAPPPAFVEAVMACPEMRSMAYLKQLLKASPSLAKRPV